MNTVLTVFDNVMNASLMRNNLGWFMLYNLVTMCTAMRSHLGISWSKIYIGNFLIHSCHSVSPRGKVKTL